MSKHLLRTSAFATSLALGLALLAGVTLVPRLAHAATFTVTDCTQYGTASTAGTLAKAFADAEANAGADTITFGCDTTSGSPIVFPAAVSPTQDLTLDATGHSVTLSGGNATSLFTLSTSGITLTLEHLTITMGKSGTLGVGGAIYSVGTNLTLIDCVLTQNTATGTVGGAGGAIAVIDANVLIEGSTFSENSVIGTGAGNFGGGGAVAVGNGSLEIEASTFSGNSVTSDTAEGGAVYLASAQSDVTNSTFTGNSVTSTSATAATGIALGGAILLDSQVGTTQIANSTITGNTADGSASEGAAGGGIVAYPTNTVPLALINDTIAANTVTGSGHLIGSNLVNGAITANITAVNTIISGGQGASNCDAAITDNGHNLDSGSSCGFPVADSNQDPKLAALAGNGGPTQTMALLTGSPAIDAGDDTVCANAPVSTQDQRGVTRPQGAHCDIGAYDLVTPIATTTSLSASATALTCGQKVALTATVSAVGVVPTTGTVTFKDGATTLGTATLSSGKATFSTTKLDNGTHSLTAVYSGTSLTGTTAGFLTSTSAKVTVTVTGCQGLGGLGPAPQAPPQAPQAPQPIPAGGANSPATSNGPATGLIPDPSTIQSKLHALAPKGHPTTAATSPSFPIQVILLLAGLLLAGIGATGLVLNRRRAA